MSEHRDRLGALGYAVNQGIQAYASVHKYIEEQGATAKSALKNLFGRGTPMSQLLDAAKSLVPIWVDIESNVLVCRAQTAFLLDEDEQRYLDALSEYVTGVRAAIDALVERQRLLATPPVQWNAHQAASQKYRDAMNHFMVAEEKMNRASLWSK